MENYDLIVVGAGASGLLAAVAARRLGRNVLVVDAAERAGGSSLDGPGLLWIPAHDLGGPKATLDPGDAVEYLDALLGVPVGGSTAARRNAFVTASARLARWLTQSNIALTPVRGLADHSPELPGGRTQGRVLQVGLFDPGVPGDWGTYLPGADPRQRRRRLLGGFGLQPFADGLALVAHLVHRATATGVEIWLNSPVIELIGTSRSVTGVVVDRDGSKVNLHAPAVLLAGGGFEASQGMREEFLPLPTDAGWTTCTAGNHGEVMSMAIGLGATTAGLEEAWWLPVMLAEGGVHSLEEVRAKPHCLIVDSIGDRFVNEAAPAYVVGRALYERSRGIRAIPSYLIMDNRHRQHYELGPWSAGGNSKRALEDGEIVRAETLNDLARTLGMDRAGLLGSVVRFNGFAAKGRDLDFRRGESAWDAALGDPRQRRHPNLGKVDKSPFWAVRVYPGDQGTKGGLLIDENTRVLGTEGRPIEGLYASGGAAASLFRGASPGPGAALGAALTESFIAATGLDS